MAKETAYNNTLVSGAADETLTYTRYVKDESSGKSTKELLDEKVNKTDQLGTTQIADKAVTTEKLENESVTTDKLDAASVTTEKVADANITTSKLADSSVETEKINNKAVTTDKLNDGAVDNSKLSPNAVTSEKIKDESIITEKLNDRAVTTEKVEEKAITNAKLGDQSVDGRVVREASLESKHFSNESVTTEKVARKSITKDKLADNAVDASQVVDGSIDNAKLSPDSVTTEKIKDGSVTNEKIADNTLGIGKFDPELRKTIQAATGLPEDLNQMIQDIDQSVKQLHEKDTDLQSQIDDKQQQITANDEDISLLQARSTQMEETIKSIAATGGASQATAVTYNNEKSKLTAVNIQSAVDEVVDKTAIKDEEGNVQDTPFRVIENEEFIIGVVDSEDKVLFGFHRATGKPYYPLNEMYHVIQNEEYFAAWLDAEGKVVLGIRRDGEIIGEIYAVNALKQVISQLQSDAASLQEKLGTIDTNLKELLDVFSLQDNEEYLAVEQDAEGKILSSTNPDGSHYIHNAKSETIPEEFSHIEDPEGRTEITTDAADKLLGYREKDGTKYEYKQKVENMSVNHFSKLSQTACQDIVNSLSAYGLTLENKLDFSDNTDIFIPIPRGVAVVNIIADSLATSKAQNKDAMLEFWGSGIYFRKNIILNAQGETSMNFAKKNQSLDFKDGTSIKFGDWVSQDSFHLKANADDVFCGLNNVVYKYADYVVGKTDTRANRVLCSATTSYQNASGNFNADFDDNAKCMPDGFPISLHLNGEFYGMYSWNMKKHRANYSMDKKDYTSIMIDPDSLTSKTFWNGTIDWSKFELKNPKTLICMDGSKYDGDNPKELIDSTSEKYDESNKDMKNTADTKTLLVRLSNAMPAINALTSEEEKKAKFKELFDYDNLVVYFFVSNAIGNYDGLWGRNTVFTIYNGGKCGFNFYDCNAVFGREARGFYNIKPDELEKATGTPFSMLFDLFRDELSAKYKVLRDKGFISTDTIIKYLEDWLNTLGTYSIKKNMEKWNNIVSYRDGSKTYPSYPQEYGFFDSLERCKKWLERRIAFMDSTFNYNVKQ